MAIATDQQVQTFFNERTRQECPLIRSLVAKFDADIAQYDDIYAALTQQSPEWKDTRSDSPPVLGTVNDELAMNAFRHDVCDYIKKHAAWPVVQKLCIHAVPNDSQQ